jgi:hypothetical protein
VAAGHPSPALEGAATTTTTGAAGDTATTGATTPAVTAGDTATTVAALGGIAFPNRSLTPGATDPRVTQADLAQTICTSGYTTTVRPPESVTEAIKVRAMAAYHLGGSLSSYELDHLIPLELGGAADVRNLWPEPWERRGDRVAGPGGGAESKDQVENAANRAVCSGRISLAAAQQAMAANWYSFGQSLGVA